MTYWEAVLLGIVEGLTEFLPISSTAHLMLARFVLQIPKSAMWETFLIVIQPGAILAVLLLYWRPLLVEWRVLVRVLIAFVPTGALGYLLHGQIEKLLENERAALWGLGIGGVVIILFELFHRQREDALTDVAKMPYWKCVAIGFIQAISMFPGVSRAAATILGGLALGLKRKAAVEFSFLLAIPTMLIASAYQLYKKKDELVFADFPPMAVGFVVSFIVALLAVKFLLLYIRTHNFIWFGVYRIGIAVVGGLILFFGFGQST